MNSTVSFVVQKECLTTKARLGQLKTMHSNVLTPIFMPVGTHAAIRSQRIDEIEQLGFEILLANTYHLILRPGTEFFSDKKIGIREFSGWKNGFLTDSGGFQVFSLAGSRKITEEGAIFQSHIDGKKLLLTPESSIKAQKIFQSDIMMVLDECIPSSCEKDIAIRAMELTHRWAKRSLDERKESRQGVFAIVQGAVFEDLRIQSAQALTSLKSNGLPFDGYAIGGLAVGEDKEQRESMTETVVLHLPKNKPRYLMGVGTPLDVLEAVARGVDMFDCVLPTMLGQQGVAFTSFGKIDLRKSRFFDEQNPIDQECSCFVCKRFTRSYLHHLVKTYDISAASFIGYHNIAFFSQLMSEIRTSLAEEAFPLYYKSKRTKFASENEDIHIEKFSSYELIERKNRYNQYVVSVKHKASGEVMHSSEDPYRESKKLYVEQLSLSQRMISAWENDKAFVIWDVGLGAATNASGAIEVYEDLLKDSLLTNLKKRLIIESFEITLEPLSLVLSRKAKFPHTQHPWVSKIFSDKLVEDYDFTWRLFLGDFLDHMSLAKKPDVIFFDPFSYKVDTPLWTYESFKKILEVIKDTDSIAATFSAATRVRSALLSAGFWVAKGEGTGLKKETTVFMTQNAVSKNEKFELLDKQWLSKWERSHSKYPDDILPEDIAAFDLLIRNHPQFLR